MHRSGTLFLQYHKKTPYRLQCRFYHQSLQLVHRRSSPSLFPSYTTYSFLCGTPTKNKHILPLQNHLNVCSLQLNLQNNPEISNLDYSNWFLHDVFSSEHIYSLVMRSYSWVQNCGGHRGHSLPLIEHGVVSLNPIG